MLLNGEMHLYGDPNPTHGGYGVLQFTAKNFEVPEHWPDLLVRFLESLHVPRRGADVEEAVLAWLEDVETVPGMSEWNGPYTTATDKLVQLARAIRAAR